VDCDPLETTATIVAGGVVGSLAGTVGLTGRTSFTSLSSWSVDLALISESISVAGSKSAELSGVAGGSGWLASPDLENLDCFVDRLGVELMAMTQTLAGKTLASGIAGEDNRQGLLAQQRLH
jgi:hypothetical protein